MFATQAGCKPGLMTFGFQHQVQNISSQHLNDTLGHKLKIVYDAAQVLLHHRLLWLEGLFIVLPLSLQGFLFSIFQKAAWVKAHYFEASYENGALKL
ncbi:hypothetical protein [Oligoflexus sp.]|uniref:hypothetical protein n=1 Tax=Oligoflexus sp. TaxID=1971216 RepID=UPI002D77A9F9|nr:hypothetical protein [Oligoflexus sp.]